MPRTASSTDTRVRTATREVPLPKSKSEGPLSQRLAAAASDLALNVAALAREAVEDFRRSDRYFKYKALIVVSWFVLATTTLGVACPGSGHRTAEFGAKILPDAPGRPGFFVQNKSEDTWTEVIFIVNGQWRASIAVVKPGDIVAITPKQLMGPGGKAAPSDLVFRDVEMRTEEGRAMLREEGQNLDD